MAKTKRLKTVTAGRLVFAVCYTQARPCDSPTARAAKSKCSSLARQKLNFRFAWQKLWLVLAANFRRGGAYGSAGNRHDLWVTLGYDDGHLPPNRRAAKDEIKKFWKRMREARRRQGDELKYVYCTHEIQDDGSRRLHHHFIVSAGSARQDFELIRALWTGGSNIEIRAIGDSDKYPYDDFMELAKYMMHERNPEQSGHATGDRGYSGSRNLVKPQADSRMVDDGESVGVPPGAYVIERENKVNEFGSFDYIFYLLPERPPRKEHKVYNFSVSG